jgi:hypothetical protein
MMGVSEDEYLLPNSGIIYALVMMRCPTYLIQMNGQRQ